MLVISGHAVGLVKSLVGLISQAPIELFARCLRECLPGSTHIREFGIATLRGERIGHKERAHGGLRQVYLIVVPADLAIGENPDAPTVALDIGHIEDLGVLGGEILLPHVNLQIAELATEAHECCLVEGLISEQQQFVFRPQLPDCRNIAF